MSALQSYQRQTSRSWTRVDMLLALYDFGLRTAATGIESLRHGDRQQVPTHRCKMQRVIVELLDGLDPEDTASSEPIQRLLHFISEAIATDDAQRWAAVHRILLTLRDGFAQVREDAVRLEQSGAIPPPADAHGVTTLA